MSVLVYTESENGKFKKNALEAASYAYAVAQEMGTDVTAVSFGVSDNSELANYGVNKVLKVQDDSLKTFNAKAYATVIAEAVKKEEVKVVVMSSSTDSKYLGGLLAGMLKAGYVPNAVATPDSVSPMVVKRMAFSNKGFAHTEINTEIKLIGVSNNAFGTRDNKTDLAEEDFSPTLADGVFSTKSVDVDKVAGEVTIADADIVVSAGRGLKGPENWGMIEELAHVLGAATACSKPVSDMGWRPHGEHVGQTGKPVASNLYIAIGISGAIQHLAGVSASKVKVVINTDPEAPFFKAADYGIVGDAFEVVPKLIEKLKEFKAQNA
jgi:electron transfer flavoprotein alpha subunit